MKAFVEILKVSWGTYYSTFPPFFLLRFRFHAHVGATVDDTKQIRSVDDTILSGTGKSPLVAICKCTSLGRRLRRLRLKVPVLLSGIKGSRRVLGTRLRHLEGCNLSSTGSRPIHINTRNIPQVITIRMPLLRSRNNGLWWYLRCWRR
jgi:hypothetical protein